MDRNNVVRIAAMCAMLAALASLPAEAGWADRLPVGKDALVVKSAAGDIRCEIRDEANQPIPGFTLSECTPLYGDDLELIVTWKNGPDVTSLANRPVILHFELRDADIYSFRFGQP